MTGRKVAQGAEDDLFWKILTTTVPADRVSLSSVDLSRLGQRHIQLFEVLVTESLAKACPDLQWQVTQVVGDQGVDLRGQGQALQCRINASEITMAYVVIGQVKRSREFSYDKAAGIIDRVLDGVRDELAISHFLVVISGRGRTAQRYRQRIMGKARERLPGIPTTVIDATEFVAAWQADSGSVVASIERALPPDQLSFVAEYLRRRGTSDISGGWRIDIESPVGARVRGACLDLRLTIRAPICLPNHEIGIAWRPSSQIDVVRPLSALAHESGTGCLRLNLDEDGLAHLPLRFRATSIGAIDLGQLELVEGAGAHASSGREVPVFSLGTVEISSGFDLQSVPYLPDAHRSATARLDEVLARTLAGGIEAVALIGPGGIGKTRLIDDMIDRLHLARTQIDSKPSRLSLVARVEHDTERSRSRRFLLDLALTIARPRIQPDDNVVGDYGQVLRNWMRRFTLDATSLVDAAIDGVVQGVHSGSPTPVALLLTLCVIARIREGPVFLHLANLHWADKFEIDVITELVSRLRLAARSLPAGVLIVLEGRTSEMLDPLEGTQTTAAWEQMCASQNVLTVSLEAWDDKQSRAFLRQILYSIGCPRHRIAAQDPLTSDIGWRRIQDHILGGSTGNPLQIIEHVRLLLETGVLVFDLEGIPVIARPPELLESAAQSLVKLVLARVEYARRKLTNRELVAFLRVLSEIGLTVGQDIFEAVAGALSDPRDVWRVEEFQVARVPVGSTHRFRFLHETYRFAFRQIPWSHCPDALRLAALARLGSGVDLPAGLMIAWSRLMRLDQNCDVNKVLDTLLTGLRRAEENYDYDAVATLCQELLVLPSNRLDAGPLKRSRIRKALADALIGSGNWEIALEILTSIAEMPRDGFGLETDLFDAELAQDRGNVLGDLLQCAQGIKVVREGLFFLNRWAKETDQRVLRVRELLLNRLGVLQWFSGRADLGIRFQWQALKSARCYDPGGEREILYSCEVGTVLLHRYPRQGRLLLERACKLLSKQEGTLRPTLDYVQSQHEMARLLDPAEAKNVKDIELNSLAIAKGRHQAPSIYGGCLAWLTAAAAAFLGGRTHDSEEYLTEALWLAERGRNLRVAWKVHLGLATVLCIRGKASSATIHARRAAEILLASLDHVGVNMWVDWAAMIRMPLEHARRMIGSNYEALDGCLHLIDAGHQPNWTTDWSGRPSAFSRSRQCFQILHVRSGEHDMFLIG